MADAWLHRWIVETGAIQSPRPTVSMWGGITQSTVAKLYRSPHDKAPEWHMHEMAFPVNPDTKSSFEDVQATDPFEIESADVKRFFGFHGFSYPLGAPESQATQSLRWDIGKYRGPCPIRRDSVTRQIPAPKMTAYDPLPNYIPAAWRHTFDDIFGTESLQKKMNYDEFALGFLYKFVFRWDRAD